MSTKRILHWYETEADAQVINRNQWNLQLAQSVLRKVGESPRTNVVWRSLSCPLNDSSTTIEWQIDHYALGWTFTEPQLGQKVLINGNMWQPCKKGESYNLDEEGRWERSQTPGDPDWLNIGVIKYRYPNDPNFPGIHIVVDIKNEITGGYEPIFFDETPLPPQSSAKYQPTDRVTWWLDYGYRTGVINITTLSRKVVFDFANPRVPGDGRLGWTFTYRINVPPAEQGGSITPGFPPNIPKPIPPFPQPPSTMSTSRALHWYEDPIAAETIKRYSMSLQIARPVKSGNEKHPITNVIWRSFQYTAPSTTIVWQDDYALAWATDIPGAGGHFAIHGGWQPCRKGESYDLDHSGNWVPSHTPGDPSSLNVGVIYYNPDPLYGIRLVVGLKYETTGDYTPIFIDPVVLPPGSAAAYQPLDEAKWWLQAGGDRTGEVIESSASHDSMTFDFTNPSDPLTGRHEWSTTYRFAPVIDEGGWSVTPGLPPNDFLDFAPPDHINSDPFHVSAKTRSSTTPQDVIPTWLVLFTPPIDPPSMKNVQVALFNKLLKHYQGCNLHVEWLHYPDGSKLKVMIGPPPNETNNTDSNTPSDLGSGNRVEPRVAIENALKTLVAEGFLPDYESWVIVYDASEKPSAPVSEPAEVVAA